MIPFFSFLIGVDIEMDCMCCSFFFHPPAEPLKSYTEEMPPTITKSALWYGSINQI